MAKSRIINTRFWDDNYTSDLDPIEKLLFLYLLTNTSTNIAGVYEIPLKKIANETGIDKDMIQKILNRFDEDKKVFYVEGWVWIKNFIKNQNQRSPQVQEGISRELEAVPSHIKGIVEEKIKGIDTLSHLTKPNLTKPNLTKPNLTQPNLSEPKVSQAIVKFIDLWKDINPAYRNFFGNKTERRDSEALLKISPLEEWVILLPLLKKMNAEQYAKGKSTKPTELLRNIGHFKAWIDQKRAPDPKRKVAVISND